MALINPNEPLGLPRGSVRAILALALGFSACAIAMAEAMRIHTVPDWFINLVVMAVTFYFSTRATAAPAGGGE